jgi:hypothetical protein
MAHDKLKVESQLVESSEYPPTPPEASPKRDHAAVLDDELLGINEKALLRKT